MTKKRRKRDWFIPMFEDGMDTVYNNSAFPIGSFAFDTWNNAHAFAAHLRLTPIRNEKGELLLDKDDKAIMPDYGKITIVQIRTDKIDWKKVKPISKSFHLKGMRVTRDVIEFGYEFPYSKHSTVSILEESDEIYNKSTI